MHMPSASKRFEKNEISERGNPATPTNKGRSIAPKKIVPMMISSKDGAQI
jgi:hypothetical protein